MNGIDLIKKVANDWTANIKGQNIYLKKFYLFFISNFFEIVIMGFDMGFKYYSKVLYLSFYLGIGPYGPIRNIAKTILDWVANLINLIYVMRQLIYLIFYFILFYHFFPFRFISIYKCVN